MQSPLYIRLSFTPWMAPRYHGTGMARPTYGTTMHVSDKNIYRSSVTPQLGSINPERLLELDDQSPVVLGHLVGEASLERIYGLAANPAHLVETEHKQGVIIQVQDWARKRLSGDRGFHWLLPSFFYIRAIL